LLPSPFLSTILSRPHLHLHFYGMHPSPHHVSGMARVGAPVYYQCWTVLRSSGDCASLRLCSSVGPCIGGSLPSCFEGRAPHLTSSLRPWWWLLSGTPLALLDQDLPYGVPPPGDPLP
jgi:hypothetical protein